MHNAYNPKPSNDPSKTNIDLNNIQKFQLVPRSKHILVYKNATWPKRTICGGHNRRYKSVNNRTVEKAIKSTQFVVTKEYRLRATEKFMFKHSVVCLTTDVLTLKLFIFPTVYLIVLFDF
jgi:hypothetical protein